MKRQFRQDLGGRRNLGAAVLLLPLVGLALLLVLWSNTIHKDTTGNHQYKAPGPPRCTLTAVGQSWAGHPVYRLTNVSHAVLRHVTLMSWSEQNVPILYVGANVPSGLATRHPWNKTPFDLPPGQSIWFAGSVQHPYKITVLWDMQQRAVYQIYSYPLQH